MSQPALGELIGLSFQQVQKYEVGANRISASKLYLAGQALGVGVDFFFEGLDGSDQAPDGAEAIFSEMAALEEGREMATLYPQITAGKVRRRILEIVRALVDEP